LTDRPRAGRSGSAVAVQVAAAACAVALVISGCGHSSGTAAAALPRARSVYVLMQTNLCLSGLAGCYAKVRYPAGIDDAAARIRRLHPDAVTVNEACGGDLALIARRTGYHLRFASVIYHGKPLPCIRPRGRGPFGDAVLTRAAILSATSRPFASQAGPEQRRWLCASTRAGVEVCTAHLASHETIEASANAPQCAELRKVLARRASGRTLIFGGDLNHDSSCAPAGFWVRTDASARQDPGSQQVYGTAGLSSPAAVVQPAAHTDHDVLVVRARLERARLQRARLQRVQARPEPEQEPVRADRGA
jgi:endonuclease/exonuclease/phosphatase family metal-dependent hydrolase